MKILSIVAFGTLLLADLVLGNTFNGCSVYRFQAIDPIRFPGKSRSPHLHSFMGCNTLNKNTKTSAQLRKNCCTSCDNSRDKSSYWTPTLFHVSNKGKHTPLVPSSLRFYYDHIDNATSPIPENYNLVCGNSKARSPRDPEAIRAGVIWNCTKGPSALPGHKRSKRTFPMVKCKGVEGLAANVYCKSCVKRISSTKFVSAYEKGGKCPKGFFKIPSIWMSAHYDVSHINNWGKNGSAPLWLSSGDAWTLHFDFINGWSKKDALEMVKHKDPMGEFHLGGQQFRPNQPACKVADPYKEKMDYNKYIITLGESRLPGYKSWP
jgi:hypothetical protein